VELSAFVPKRLLNIGGKRVELCIDMRKPVSYVALSYYWGIGQTFKTTTTNLEDLIRLGLDLRLLPYTFGDAITVARRLGFGYI
jgi:hypothetical protein